MRRHIRAFLLQNYHQDRLPAIDPDQPHDLFSVLGNVSGFRKADSLLNRDDFAAWLAGNEETLRTRIAGWIPEQLSGDDRALFLDKFVSDYLQAVDEAIAPGPGEEDETEDEDDDDTAGDEEATEEGEEHPQQASSPGKMLDRLLYCGNTSLASMER